MPVGNEDIGGNQASKYCCAPPPPVYFCLVFVAWYADVLHMVFCRASDGRLHVGIRKHHFIFFFHLFS